MQLQELALCITDKILSLTEYAWEVMEYVYKLIAYTVAIGSLIALFEADRCLITSSQMNILLFLTTIFTLGLLAKPCQWILKLQDTVCENVLSVDSVDLYPNPKIVNIIVILLVAAVAVGLYLVISHLIILVFETILHAMQDVRSCSPT